MSKYTPGPWHFDPGSLWVGTESGKKVGFFMTEVFGRDQEWSDEANGFLCSASPELYDSVFELLESHQREDPHHEDICPICRRAKAAIAKAKGAS